MTQPKELKKESFDVIELAQELIRCPSVTPNDAGAQDFLSARLEELGFKCHHIQCAEVPNLFARIDSDKEGPHLCYGGHTDVVPPGPEDKWIYGPFNPHIENGVLYGRGASDMKGSVAAFTAAVASYFAKNGGKPKKGSISMLITGDEEGPSINGTAKVLEWMKKHDQLPDVALVGEPTNPEFLGQEIKIGRRGSLTGEITVRGKQGHVAYQHLAHNPLPQLIRILEVLSSTVFDQGSAYFPATNLEVTTIDVGNPAENIIPQSGRAMFNIRYSDRWNGQSLSTKVQEIVAGAAKGADYTLDLRRGAESFLTKPGTWSGVVADAVERVTGKRAAFTTNGGTSDARFISKYCPVVEFGGINKTIHQINEHEKVSDLHQLKEIYETILELYF